MDYNEIVAACEEFRAVEGRADFYPLAMNLLKQGLDVEAYILILATWNFANFRYFVKDFDVKEFKTRVEDLNKCFAALRDEDFSTIKFEAYSNEIVTIFDQLASIKGVFFTGASKLMHLKNPRVFVMWDSYISGQKPKKNYEALEAIKSADFTFKKYPRDGHGYLGFLQDRQSFFKNIAWDIADPTLAKAIDEWNYVKITLPLQQLEKDASKRKKEHQAKKS
jgi:hypothetical protein